MSKYGLTHIGSLYLKKMSNMHTIPIVMIARTQMHVRETVLYV